MRNIRLLTPLMVLALIAPAVLGQETVVPGQEAKTNAAPEVSAGAPDASLKLQVLITEYSGSQKLSSLPYTFYIVDQGNHSNRGSVRMGTKVPMRQGTVTANGTTSDQITYQDVGTNIDCQFIPPRGQDGRYHLAFSIQRSSVISSTGLDIKPGETIPTGQPLIRSFQENFDLFLRDGQTVEGASSVDPATGNVMKVDVTLNLQK
jgi:hypothetical protein